MLAVRHTIMSDNSVGNVATTHQKFSVHLFRSVNMLSLTCSLGSLVISLKFCFFLPKQQFYNHSKFIWNCFVFDLLKNATYFKIVQTMALICCRKLKRICHFGSTRIVVDNFHMMWLRFVWGDNLIINRVLTAHYTITSGLLANVCFIGFSVDGKYS